MIARTDTQHNHITLLPRCDDVYDLVDWHGQTFDVVATAIHLIYHGRFSFFLYIIGGSNEFEAAGKLAHGCARLYSLCTYYIGT